MKTLKTMLGVSVIILISKNAIPQTTSTATSKLYLAQDNSSQHTLSYKHKNCRWYNKAAYQIVDTESFYIYYRYQSEEQIKGKGLIKTDEYFFSMNGNSPIQLLTIDNLKNSFPENHHFHYLLDAIFRSDKELLAYDNFLKTYKIKYLYRESLK